MNKTSALVALAALTLLGACSAERVSHFPSYKLKVVQGNEPDPRAIASLQGGMSREQVRFVLGTPLVSDIFHADRWDYVYRFQPGKGASQERRLTVIFEDGRLARLDGDVRPADAAPQPAP